MPLIAGMFCGPVGIFVRRLTDFGMNNLTILFTRTAVASAILFLALLIMDRDLLKLCSTLKRKK